VINGSPRKNSNTGKVAQFVASLLENKGVEFTLFSVGTLPLYDGEETTYEHPEVKKLMTLANKADGFFICTPEYHSGMSGALKNALDFLSGSHFRKKPVAIACAAGGGKGGINALNNLRLVMRGVGGLVIANQCVVDPNDFDANDKIRETAATRLAEIVDELVDITGLLAKR
jgi:azobenzene reductase